MSGFSSIWNSKGSKSHINGHADSSECSSGTDLVPLIQSALDLALPKQPEQQRSRSDESVNRARSYAAAVLRNGGGVLVNGHNNNVDVNNVSANGNKGAGDGNIATSAKDNGDGNGNGKGAHANPFGNEMVKFSMPQIIGGKPSTGETMYIQVSRNGVIAGKDLPLAVAHLMKLQGIMPMPKPKMVDAQIQTDEVIQKTVNTQTMSQMHSRGTSPVTPVYCTRALSRDKEVTVKLCSCCHDAPRTSPVQFHGDAFTFERALSQFVSNLGISFVDVDDCVPLNGME